MDVNSSIVVENGVLSTRSNVGYNGRVYAFDVSVTSIPSFKYTMGWESPQKLKIRLFVIYFSNVYVY